MAKHEPLQPLALPALCNQLPPVAHSSLLTGEPSASSFSQDCSLLSGSLVLEALLNGVHREKCYINV